MPVPEGLRTVLNEIKHTLVQDNVVYAQQLPTIMPETTIGQFAETLFANDQFLKNDFMPALIQRIGQVSIERRLYRNPLESLKNGEMPLGGLSQNILVNKVQSAEFDVNDFAGLLVKYDVDIKVIYNRINWDHQYMATITYDNILNAFTSWDNLYNFVDEISQTMYNQAYIDDFRMTKYLISNAYRNNQVVMQTVQPLTSQENAKALVAKLRSLYSQMKFASTKYNGWNLNGGYGEPVETWALPENIVLFIKAEDMAYLDVEVWAAAFHLSSAEFLASRVYEVDNFDIINPQTGAVEFDGSKIVAAIGDRRFFDIKQQTRRYNQFFNAKNETWQLFLHVREAFNTVPFANFVMLVTETPTVDVTGMQYNPTSLTLTAGQNAIVSNNVTPATATTEITYSVTKADTASEDVTVAASDNGRSITVTATDAADGQYVVKATAGNITAELPVTVNAAVQAAAQMSADEIKATVTKEVKTQLAASQTSTTSSKSEAK